MKRRENVSIDNFRIVLDSVDFGRLVSGQVVRQSELVIAVENKVVWRLNVEVALSDLGFGVMKHLIEEAEIRAKENPGSDPASTEPNSTS